MTAHRFAGVIAILLTPVPLLARAGEPIFRDAAAESGVSFRFQTGSRGKHDLPEIMGGGVALIDADGDGRLDLYFCNGGPIVADPAHKTPSRLYLNRGGWRFEDVTAGANAPGPDYAMGAAVGDGDGDGRDDLFVTGWRGQRYYRNLGGGRFADQTETLGLQSDLWSTSAAFADLDGDGDLDLYVCNYLDFDPTKAPYCSAPDGKRDFCGPEEFNAQPDRLYRNDGGRFVEVGRSAGIDDRNGRGLGVIIADLVGDPRPDIFVANDGTACHLYQNRGGMKFAEVGLPSGVALDGSGRPLAGMGVAIGDLDDDDRPDLLVSNFLGRSTIAFRNLGAGQFEDASTAFGLRRLTATSLGFGVALEDFDGDGRLDLLQINGHVLDRERLGEPLAMPPLFLAGEKGKFRVGGDIGGPFFRAPILGRGLAVGDLDDDGRPDAVVARLDGPAALLRNEARRGKPLAIDLVGKTPSVAGAIVRAMGKKGRKTRQVVGGGSYLAASARTVFFTGEGAAIDRVEVTWPSGPTERFPIVEGKVHVKVEEGRGTRAP